MPLGKVFNGERDYLFTTQRNMRSYEWTEKEADDLLESINAFSGLNDQLELGAFIVIEKNVDDAIRGEDRKAL